MPAVVDGIFNRVPVLRVDLSDEEYFDIMFDSDKLGVVDPRLGEESFIDIVVKLKTDALEA
jgi:hypothetical protein